MRLPSGKDTEMSSKDSKDSLSTKSKKKDKTKKGMEYELNPDKMEQMKC